MRLWTLQGIEIYEQMQRDGIAYCTKPSMGDEPTFVHAYHWMAEQMRKRIGEPPIKGIEYPLWAWYQYNSAKSNKPPRSLHDACEGISAYIEIEIPEKDVLLSDFSAWHCVLNQGPINDWKRIWKKMESEEKAANKRMMLDDYSSELQREIEDSWEAIFDLDRRDNVVGRKHKSNRSIQATFWALEPEHIVSVEILEKKGDVIRQIAQPKQNL